MTQSREVRLRPAGPCRRAGADGAALARRSALGLRGPLWLPGGAGCSALWGKRPGRLYGHAPGPDPEPLQGALGPGRSGTGPQNAHRPRGCQEPTPARPCGRPWAPGATRGAKRAVAVAPRETAALGSKGSLRTANARFLRNLGWTQTQPCGQPWVRASFKRPPGWTRQWPRLSWFPRNLLPSRDVTAAETQTLSVRFNRALASNPNRLTLQKGTARAVLEGRWRVVMPCEPERD